MTRLLTLRRWFGSLVICLAFVAATAADDPRVVLTPFPERVAGTRQPLLSLCGTWRFSEAPPKDFADPVLDDTQWARIEVPGEWAMQGFTVARNTAAGYRRRFVCPADWAGKRIKLRADAVYSDALVWINGQKAGRHMGGFTPFELDVTDLVQPGRDNLIALAVKEESLTDQKFTTFGSLYAAHPVGGISRKITLLAVPELNVASFHVATTFDGDYRDATLRLMLDIANQGEKDMPDARIRFELVGPDKKPVAISPALVTLPNIKAAATLHRVIEIPVAAPAKWDAEHPNLYVVTCRLESGGQMVEAVPRRFGFRQVEVRGNRLFVNNRPVKLRGVCRHEAYAIRGRSLAPELWKKTAKLFRDANVNLIRTSHYPPAEEFIDACDELGIFVEEEAPFHHSQYILNPEYLQATLQHTAELLERDRSHPSVVIWSVGNESQWSPNFEASAELIRKIDPTRPRLFSHGRFKHYRTFGHGPMEIASRHYPGPGLAKAGQDPASHAGAPVIFDEYCHLNTYNREENATDPGLRDVWGRGFAAMWEKMVAASGCLGGALWAGVDEIFLLPPGEAVGWGAWGVIDSWHRPKPEYWHVKKVYSPVRIDRKTIPVPSRGEPIRLDVANRHDFTNLGELRIEWTLGDESGTASADIPPRSTGTITIRPRHADLASRTLAVQFVSARGFLVDRYELPIAPTGPAVKPQSESAPPGKLKLTQTDATITVTADRFAWELDHKSGMISEARIDGRAVLTGGPVLMVLPLRGGRCAQTHRADIPPLNNTCTRWQCSRVETRQTGRIAEIRVDGQYEEAAGGYWIEIDGAGRLTVCYRFTSLRKVDPRQIGVVFDLPKACDTLAWQRKAQWTVYPPDHIGRPSGQARAFRQARWPTIGPRQPPPWPWALDSNRLGTNDFRATRHNVFWASLRAPGGYGLLARSDGSQHTRAYVDGDRVRLLVAGYSNGGGDMFYARHIRAERRPLEKGSVVEDRVRLELVAPPK